MATQGKTVTLLDVARQAGVSTATISRVINDPDRVSAKTRKRVHDTIDQLGYTPNFGGQLLAAGRSNTIGAVIPTMANAMFAGGLQAFQEVLSQAGKTLLVASTGYDPTDELAQIRTLVARGAEGLLLIGAERPVETWDFLARRKIPHVITWSHSDNPARIFAGFDNRRAAMDMTERVLAFGHRRIAMISGVTAHNDRARDRQAGVRAAVANCDGASLGAVIEVRYDPEQSAEAFRSIVAAPNPPTAIICGNDVLAAGAILAARAMGIMVPDHVSVVGFDDIDLAALLYPALTTVRVPQLRMGHEAARLLLDMVAGKTDIHSELLPVEIILRESLGAPRQRG